MKCETKVFEDKKILVVTLSANDVSGNLASAHLDREFETLEAWANLDESIVESIREMQAGDRSAIPLVVMDLSDVDSDSESIEYWLRYGVSQKGNEILRFVRDRGGATVLVALSNPLSIKGILSAKTLEDGIFHVLKYVENFKTALEEQHADILSHDGGLNLCMVGCPEKDLGSIPKEFERFGIGVTSAEVASDCDPVVFCISVADGPTEGTRQAVNSLQGKTVVPLAIVLVYADVVDDASLRDLVNFEERDLLMSILPADIVDGLPLFLDVDPNLVRRITDLAKNTKTLVHCLRLS